MKREKRDKFLEQRIAQEGLGRVVRTVDHPEYAAMLSAIREHHEETSDKGGARDV